MSDAYTRGMEELSLAEEMSKLVASGEFTPDEAHEAFIAAMDNYDADLEDEEFYDEPTLEEMYAADLASGRPFAFTPEQHERHAASLQNLEACQS